METVDMMQTVVYLKGKECNVPHFKVLLLKWDVIKVKECKVQFTFFNLIHSSIINIWLL